MDPMSDYTIDVYRDPETGTVTRVEIRDGSYLVGRWQEPYSDVSATSLNDKDEVRRLVKEIRALRIH